VGVAASQTFYMHIPKEANEGIKEIEGSYKFAALADSF
jgi:hypothetical protein